MKFPDILLTTLSTAIINYTVRSDGSRVLFIEADIFDSVPSEAKGKKAQIAFATHPSSALPHAVWINSEEDRGAQANITVAEPIMDHLLALIRDFGIKDLKIGISGHQTQKLFDGKELPGICDVTSFEVRYDGPAGQWRTK